MGSEVGTAPKSISEEVGTAVLVAGKEYFLAGREMTQPKVVQQPVVLDKRV